MVKDSFRMAGQRPVIEWTPVQLASFKRAYNDATKASAAQFKWQGHDFLTAYAKYLIEYLETQFQ
jgi:hypothetical protein